MKFSGKHGETGLMRAAEIGDAAVAKEWINFGADVNEKNNLGWTSLMISANFGRFDVSELLIQKGADANLSHHSGITPLMIAADFGAPDTVDLLLKSGAKVNALSESGRSALMFAAENGHIEIVEMLIENGANPDLQTKEGDSALSLAERKKHSAVCRYLSARISDDRAGSYALADLLPESEFPDEIGFLHSLLLPNDDGLVIWSLIDQKTGKEIAEFSIEVDQLENPEEDAIAIALAAAAWNGGAGITELKIPQETSDEYETWVAVDISDHPVKIEKRLAKNGIEVESESGAILICGIS
ncbi:MAG: hypothetical protein B6244_02195 [Candidatus Cloacimonetes bacterium 4572_55]|nr:MAG: hypothetical protein B6244_02195 [Candidatus Cloacimonetes bacterium 4572_55]